MTYFELAALIIGIFFVVGIVFGFLIVLLLPVYSALRKYPDTRAIRTALTLTEIVRKPSQTSVISRDSTGQLTVNREITRDGKGFDS
jgi:uncharacterized protein YneF (UPF0154 family)